MSIFQYLCDKFGTDNVSRVNPFQPAYEDNGQLWGFVLYSHAYRIFPNSKRPGVNDFPVEIFADTARQIYTMVKSV